MKFYLEIVTRRIVVIDRDSREEALASQRAIEAHRNYDRQPGEVTTVRVLRFADHVEACDACGLGQAPCKVGREMMELEGEAASLAAVLNKGMGL